MRDVITIGIILSLAFVLPLFLSLFRSTSGQFDSAEGETESFNDRDLEATDDWPSVIGAESSR